MISEKNTGYTSLQCEREEIKKNCLQVVVVVVVEKATLFIDLGYFTLNKHWAWLNYFVILATELL